MSNHSVYNVSQGVDIGYEYSTYILGTLFFASEVLPLLKGKSNGLLHAALCLIQGSKCLLDKAEAQTKAALDNAVKNPVAENSV
jgi:hypothetical protein